jgi:hypothetical protein
MPSNPSLTQAALESAVLHLVGQSRAVLLQYEAALHEIASTQDDRGRELVDVLTATVSDPPGPGTVRDVERRASALLRSLREP